jgi:hypothetical protein
MATTVTYKGITLIEDPSSSGNPKANLTGAGGDLIQDNFKEFADRIAVCNYAAISDPTVNDDSGDGYYPGSRWLNTSSGIFWVCRSNTLGSARWVIESVGTDGASTASRFGPLLFRDTGIINFKTVAQHSIYTVPVGYMFVIDSMEIITVTSTTPGTPPTVQFGTTLDTDLFLGPVATTSNSVGSRHVAEDPQDGAIAGVILSAGITQASSAAAHTGILIFKGYELKVT